MNKTIKIISGVFAVICLSVLVVVGTIKLFIYAFPSNNQPSTQDARIISYHQCRDENKEKILDAYQKCVGDAHGNNVRCENSAIRIFCQY